MSKKWKRFMAMVLVFVMCLNLTAAADVSAAVDSKEEQNAVFSEEENTLSIEGNGSLGELLAEPLVEEQRKQEENNGCNIFSIEVDGTAAYVQLETREDAELVVAIYNESGVKMLASGSTPVSAGDESAVVEIKINAMPQYFYLRGFLIEPDSLRSVCTSYESPNYTKDMQDFLAATTDDYDAERVLNFDGSKDTNFAVYAESTILLHTEAPDVNRITVLDEAKQSYRIEDADAAALALTAGDVFSCTLADGTVLVVKVGEITVDGRTVTVAGQDDLAIKEVFSYVKIEENLGMEDVQVDDTPCDEGVIYNGLVDVEPAGTRSTNGSMSYLDGSETQTKEMDYTFADKKIGSGNTTALLNGSLKLSINNSFEYYLTLSNTYVSMKMDYNGTFAINMSGPANGSVTIAKMTFTALGVLNLTLTPEIMFDANAKLDIAGKIYGTVGYFCSVQEGMKNLTTAPKLETSLEAEADLYVGMKLRPSVEFILDKIAKVSLTATVGGRVTGKMMMSNVPTNGVRHECTSCIGGDVFGKYSVSFQANLLDQDWLTYTYHVTDQTVKVLDFYYSIDRNESALTSCPHILYLVTVTVKDTAGVPVSGAAINDSNTTDVAGQVSLWLANGKQTLTASKNGYSISKEITISERAQSVVMILCGQSGTDGSGDDSFDSSNQGEIKQISMGDSCTGAVKKDGSLYLWGSNIYGEIGDGTTASRWKPIKINDDNRVGGLREGSVEKLSLGTHHSAAITKDGSLYLWGWNKYGQLGDGTTTDRTVPVKILENISEVSLGEEHSAAITKDGSLYLWGDNGNGQLGDGTTTDRILPVKVMENVTEVSLGSFYSAAITKDGSLYLWGSNTFGRLGDGTTTNKSRPVKVMENVSEVSLYSGHSAAITKDGSLYLWGKNNYGQLGDGTMTDRNRPVKIAQNIAHVSLGYEHSAVITKDGSLYLWGKNSSGQLGDGTTTDRHQPVKVMENVTEVSLGHSNSAAITKDGSLYLWGGNESTPTRFIIDSDGTQSLHALEESAPVYQSIASYSAQTDTETADVEDAAIGQTVRAVAGSKTATYTKLKPNADYIFYSMKYKGDSHPLSASNLLYLRQVRTDEKGSFTLSYTPDEYYATPTDFVVAMAQMDIGEAQVTVPSLSYSGTEQYVNPLLIHNEQRLTEGTDYRLTGDYRADDVGEYSFTVTGIGAFTGSLHVTYQVEKKDCKTLTIDPVEPVTFDGSAVTPALVVKNGEVTLEQGKDYTVSYQNNKGAGIGIAEISGKGNYGGRQFVLFDILPCALDAAMLSPIPEQEYTGEPLTPEPVLKHGEAALVPGVDYRTEYADNVEVGTATVTVTGIGSYTGSITGQFTIIPKKSGGEGDKEPEEGKTDCRNLDIAELTPLTYTGNPLTPEPVVKDKDTVLVRDKDYTVDYRNNTNAGTGIIIITGKGNYEGSQIVLFDILPCALADDMLSEVPEQEYTGKPLTPELTLKHGEMMLVPGMDYRVEYSDNVETGTAAVTVTGIGSYTGSIATQFMIIPKQSSGEDDKDPDDGKDPGDDKNPQDGRRDCRNLDIAELTPLTYTGSALTPEPVVKDKDTVLVKDKDYTVAYRNNTNAGTGIAIITGKGNYEGSQIVLFDILPCALDASMLSPIPEQKYTGKALTPGLVLKNGTSSLILGIDYRVSYANNIKAGTAKVTVTGTGNYTGTISAQFKITDQTESTSEKKPAKVKLSSLKASGKKKLTVKWKKVSKASGYEIQCSLKKNFKSGVKKLTVKKGSITTAAVKKLTPKKQYYVRVRAYKTVKKNGKNTKLYGAWSKTTRSKKIK